MDQNFNHGQGCGGREATLTERLRVLLGYVQVRRWQPGLVIPSSLLGQVLAGSAWTTAFVRAASHRRPESLHVRATRHGVALSTASPGASVRRRRRVKRC